jgi:hypothetical protein
MTVFPVKEMLIYRHGVFGMNKRDIETSVLTLSEFGTAKKMIQNLFAELSERRKRRFPHDRSNICARTATASLF